MKNRSVGMVLFLLCCCLIFYRGSRLYGISYDKAGVKIVETRHSESKDAQTGTTEIKNAEIKKEQPGNEKIKRPERKNEYSLSESRIKKDAGTNWTDQDYMIAFTFDDGPHPVWTRKLLDGLKERGIKATFFVIGENAEKYPELIQRMVEEGNQVGNHTYSHVQLTGCAENTAVEEIQKTQDVIYGNTGFYPQYIRPPFGSWNSSLQEKTNLEAVLWDVDPYDWKTRNADQVVSRIINQTKDGSIILLHDIYETSVDAALRAADVFLEKGYRFCTIDEIMIE